MPACTTDRHFSPECYQTPEVSYATAGPRANQLPSARQSGRTDESWTRVGDGGLRSKFLTQLIIQTTQPNIIQTNKTRPKQYGYSVTSTLGPCNHTVLVSKPVNVLCVLTF